jgi:hypothetical protein
MLLSSLVFCDSVRLIRTHAAADAVVLNLLLFRRRDGSYRRAQAAKWQRMPTNSCHNRHARA